jgi:hypothetical protein
MAYDGLCSLWREGKEQDCPKPTDSIFGTRDKPAEEEGNY